MPRSKRQITDDTRSKAQARIDAENAIAGKVNWKKLAKPAQKLVERLVRAAGKGDLKPDLYGTTAFERVVVARVSEQFLRALWPEAIKAISRGAGRKSKTPDISRASYPDLVRAYDDLGLTSGRAEVQAAAWRIAGKALFAVRRRIAEAG